MKRDLSQRWFAFVVLSLMGDVAISWDDAAPATSTGTSSAAALQHDQSAPKVGSADLSAQATKILGLCDDAGKRIDQNALSSSGLGDELWVVVRTSDASAAAPTSGGPPVCTVPNGTSTGASATAPAVQLDASQYALFFNGRELAALDGTVYDSSRHAFGFHLTRNDQNKPIWAGILGSPTTSLHRQVVVSLGLRGDSTSPQPTISGDGQNATFQLRLFSWQWLTVAIAATIAVISIVWGHAKSRTTLRDNLLPQLEAARQPYSLGRWQMAFWFTLIFTSFLFLFILLWDTNTISTQALSLMGISGTTALAAVAIDVAKDSPADAANRGLQALGLNTYVDVVRVRQEIKDRELELAGLPPSSQAISASARRQQLQIEIQDRHNILRTYEDKIQPFVSRGWFTDLTTDLNGTALHRLQVFCWTIALGIVFLISVYRQLSMPDFNGNLLALMGISSAGYIGFKIPEAGS